MPTDTERREVARKLRLYGNREHANFCMAYVVAAMGIDLIETIEHRDDAKLYRTLADLIDPDTTTDTTKSPELTTKCDRDALLSLAEDVDGAADDSGGLEPLAGMLRDIARRIREALGVADG